MSSWIYVFNVRSTYWISTMQSDWRKNTNSVKINDIQSNKETFDILPKNKTLWITFSSSSSSLEFNFIILISWYHPSFFEKWGSRIILHLSRLQVVIYRLLPDLEFKFYLEFDCLPLVSPNNPKNLPEIIYWRTFASG